MAAAENTDADAGAREARAGASSPTATPPAGLGAAAGVPSGVDDHPARWPMLALLSAAVLLGMSLWFTASAVAPRLQAMWDLSPAQAGWLTMIVQLGFVAGTAAAAALNLADIVPARGYFAVSAVLGAAANAALLLVSDYPTALVTRFLAGFFLAGVYPPAMKMAATWFRSMRGLAIGTIVGALTVGKATPYLLNALEESGFEAVVLTTSAGALAAALLVAAAYRDGPHPFPRQPFSWGLAGLVLRHRETRLATAGYLGHMWEIYAMWGLIAVFFLDFFAGRDGSAAPAAALAGIAAFAAIGVGGFGAVLAGRWADRFGRERVTIAAMAVSGSCALLIGWLLHAPATVVLLVALVWGFAVVADSAQFSAIVTEVAPRHAVGTALTIQTCAGFALTAVAIGVALELRAIGGWPLAFGMLAVGPALGIVAMVRLLHLRRSREPRATTGGSAPAGG